MSSIMLVVIALMLVVVLFVSTLVMVVVALVHVKVVVVVVACQDQFFTDLISMRGLGVRGWPSSKTEMLCSIVMLPEW